MSTNNFSTFNYLLNNTVDTSRNSAVEGLIQGLKDNMFAAKVVDISLNQNSKMWEKGGKWGTIGSIRFQLMDQPTKTQNNVNDDFSNVALPLFPQIKYYPLVNETVLIFKLPNTSQTQISGKSSYYYLNNVNIWNHPQQNGFPNVYSYNSQADSQNKSYEEIEAGNTQKVSDESNEINLNGFSGGTFNESSSINPILAFAGDNIIEGRFGNSIRLGNSSTISGTNTIKNNWSQGSMDGSPITILRNGQAVTESRAWVPITENINVDLSSIYMTSNQMIPISSSILTEDTANTVPFGDMVDKTPISPNKFSQPQIILNSSRLLFNSTSDSIIASAKKSIILESVDDLGIKSRDKNVTIYSEKGIVSLGRKNARSSAILGNKFSEQFDKLMGQLVVLLEALNIEPGLKTSKPQIQTVLTSVKGIKTATTGSAILSKFVKLS